MFSLNVHANCYRQFRRLITIYKKAYNNIAINTPTL